MRRRTAPGTLAVWLAVTTALLPAAARAHVEGGQAGGLLSGFLHPVSGADHVVAMVEVGRGGAVLGPPALWRLPVACPGGRGLGGVVGLRGRPRPAVEIGIAVSGVVLGLMVLLERRPPLWLALLLVGLFALFHGHAHGSELPEGASALLYSLAFVIATGLLHLVGILIGELRRWPLGRRFVQLAGGGVAVAGLVFLVGAL